MARKLVGAILLGVLGAAYATLYHYVDEPHRGLFVFASLLAAVASARRGKGGCDGRVS